MHEALRTFLALGAFLFAAGLILVLRFLYFFWIGESQGHIQSFILAAILILVGFLIHLLGLLADLIARNRRLSEEMLYRVRKMETGNSKDCQVMICFTCLIMHFNSILTLRDLVEV